MAVRGVDPVEERKSYGTVFFLGICLLLGLSLWALYDDNFSRRPWKKYQAEFYRMDYAKAQSAYDEEDKKLKTASDEDLLPAVILAVEDYFRELEIVIDPGFKAQAVNKIFIAEVTKRAATQTAPSEFDIADYHDQLSFAKMAFDSGLETMKRRLEPLGVVFDRNYQPKLRGRDEQ